MAKERFRIISYSTDSEDIRQGNYHDVVERHRRQILVRTGKQSRFYLSLHQLCIKIMQ